MPSREDFVAVATRLFAVCLALFALRHAVTTYGVWQQMADPSMLVLAGAAVPMLLIAWLLWTFPLTIARKLLPVMKTPPAPIAWRSPGALDLGLSLIGLTLLAMALGDVAYWAVLLLMTFRLNHDLEMLQPGDWASLLATAAEVAIALWLLLGPRGVLLALTRLRYAGAREADPEA